MKTLTRSDTAQLIARIWSIVKTTANGKTKIPPGFAHFNFDTNGSLVMRMPGSPEDAKVLWPYQDGMIFLFDPDNKSGQPDFVFMVEKVSPENMILTEGFKSPAKLYLKAEPVK